MVMAFNTKRVLLTGRKMTQGAMGLKDKRRVARDRSIAHN
jgi:hypothetical protein